MATANISTDSRTIHTVHISIPDDILGALESGDQVEVMFSSRIASGRMPRPVMLSWSMVNYLLGDGRK
jgi:hypothetical protein